MDGAKEHSGTFIKLLSQLGKQVSLLARKQLQLVQTEALANVKSETSMIIFFVLSAVLGLVGFMVIAATLVMVLQYIMPLWLAGVVVSVALILSSILLAFLGARKSVKSPWTRTREVIRSDIKMAKEGFA